MTKKNWLLVGGSGFLGTHLRNLLCSSGETISTVYNKSLAPHIFDHRLETFHSTVEFENSIGDSVIKDSAVAVYLASSSIPATYAKQPWLEFESNASNAMRFFMRCASLNPSIRVVYLSSGGTIYGSAGDAPIDETSPLSPCSPYGLGKLCVENALAYVGRMHALSYGILRISNPIGRWQKSVSQGIATAALRSAATGLPLPLFGNGNQIRDFVDADDVAKAIMLCGKATHHRNAVWNVGSGKGTRVLDLVRLVESVTGRQIQLSELPARSSDVQAIVLNPSKIERDLGWTNEKAILESIEDVWRENYAEQLTLKSRDK